MQPDLCVIPVEGDGRCFFRCIVASTSPELQRTNIDEHGKMSNGIYRLLETMRSDKLRAEVVEFMVENMDEFDHHATIINADEPGHIRYANVQDRLTDMAMAMTMPGEMEVSAAAAYLEKTIVIHTTNRAIVNTYGSQHNLNGTIRLQFTTVGTDVGHYDLLNIERANHEPVSPVTQRVPLTMISPIPKRKRKQRSNDTSILLSKSVQNTTNK